ncbi:MAG: S41 family peptidase [Syntrophales bacterium]|nr:S41 family peptidase [Syntrophales bacterium]
MRRRNSLLFLFIILWGILIFIGPYSDSGVSAAIERGIYKELKTFTEVLDIVQKNYIEPVKVQDLIRGAITGMIKSLDPHSSYMTADMYKELKLETEGTFGGVGIEITIHRGVLTVVSPIEDTPAYMAGIKAGDQIIMINDEPTKDMSIVDAVKRIRGPKGTKVKLSILREGETRLKEFVITRAIIKVASVKHKLVDEGIGYIRVSSFQERTTEDLLKALGELNGKTHLLKGIVLDLRNNPGGLFEQAVSVSDAFLKSGVIVYTRGRTKGMEKREVARDDGSEPSCPMVVLVNEGTASAAEIVAGALQDHGRALLLGTQTFGKGSVQTVIPLENGDALKLTTARYFTPKGRSIQAEGITPDIIVKYQRSPDEEDGDEYIVREKDLRGHIPSTQEKENGTVVDKGKAPKVPIRIPGENDKRKDVFKKREFGDVNRDNQLRAAVDILKSWEIFKKQTKREG